MYDERKKRLNKLDKKTLRLTEGYDPLDYKVGFSDYPSNYPELMYKPIYWEGYYPVVGAIRDGGSLVIPRCIRCGCTHKHGVAEGSEKGSYDGGRSPHCYIFQGRYPDEYVVKEMTLEEYKETHIFTDSMI